MTSSKLSSPGGVDVVPEALSSPLESSEHDRSHAAAAAWRKLSRNPLPPLAIEVLKPEHRKSAVYRLVGAAKNGENVIAKLCAKNTASTEDTMYTRLLRFLDSSSARYYGTIESTDPALAWLFLEDLGDVRFSLTDRDHRKAAAIWLAGFHFQPVSDESRAMLPSRGLDEYLEILRVAHDTVRTGLTNPALSPKDVAVLEDIASHCRTLESRPAIIKDVCRSIPPAVVHGDLGAKNVRMVVRAGSWTFIPFDWETSGWGCPAIDLSVMDVPTYWDFAREKRRSLDRDELTRAVCLGRVFWCLAPIRGEGGSLAAGWVEGVMGKMQFYRDQIAEAMALIV